MKRIDGQIIYSPSDLVTYLKSPFAAWMDRYYLENKGQIVPDELSAEEKLIAETGNEHEEKMLERFRETYGDGLIEIPKRDFAEGNRLTLAALENRAPMVYQAALQMDQFEGWADFIKLESDGLGSDGLGSEGWYQVWDSKLARSPKPYYAIQLCCYSEMLAKTLNTEKPKRFGIILGNEEDVEFALEDFYYYYLQLKHDFLEMQKNFTGDFSDRPEPLPMAEHGRWSSHAEKYFVDTDHLVRVAGIKGSQIKKLNDAGIMSMSQLAEASGNKKTKLAQDTLEKLVAQARLQCLTMAERTKNPKAEPCFEILTAQGKNGEAVGLALLPPAHEKDVFFDMEGYPLAPGGLEYLFGACTRKRVIVDGKEGFEFLDWWGHDREGEKRAFEEFIDWVYHRWLSNPEMHIYHYGDYEKTALRKLSTLHDTRQDEVDNLLRNNVLVDLYKIVLGGVRIGEESYSIKSVEKLYFTRKTDVNTAVDSVVQYANWIESGESRDWKESESLLKIREYNEEDCNSTIGLEQWLRNKRQDLGEDWAQSSLNVHTDTVALEVEPNEKQLRKRERVDLAAKLRQMMDENATIYGDVLGFYDREHKAAAWKKFDKLEASIENLFENDECLAGVKAVGEPVGIGGNQEQTYAFDAAQEFKLVDQDGLKMKFTHQARTFFAVDINATEGKLKLSISIANLNTHFGGKFPQAGSLFWEDSYVATDAMEKALSAISKQRIEGKTIPVIDSLINRNQLETVKMQDQETAAEAAIRVTSEMNGHCLVIQGPPGTGKTYTAAKVIAHLLGQGKKVGICSNTHKAIEHLMRECGKVLRDSGKNLIGVKAGGQQTGDLYEENPDVKFVTNNEGAQRRYQKGVLGGTAWLFSRPEWVGTLDYLFVDEAGQVSFANAMAIARSATNLILLGDQMQLEQPVKGTHPGDAGLSVLQYALKDVDASKPDAPIFHAVVPPDRGIFLSETWRMHPDVCGFVSDSIYQGQLGCNPDCGKQRIAIKPKNGGHIAKGSGVIFSGIEHDGNVERSHEEANRVREIYDELIGCEFTDRHGKPCELTVKDFLFIAPYNAQLSVLKKVLPKEARVGTVDKFQGQEAPVCIYTLCSSYGEYGARGLEFILNQNRVNVAISRAKCLAVVVGDPRICRSPATKIEEMKLINLLCKIKQISA